MEDNPFFFNVPVRKKTVLQKKMNQFKKLNYFKKKWTTLKYWTSLEIKWSQFKNWTITYTIGLQGVSEGIVSAFSSWKPTSENLTYHPWYLFVPLQKNLLLSIIIIPLPEVHWLFAQA